MVVVEEAHGHQDLANFHFEAVSCKFNHLKDLVQFILGWSRHQGRSDATFVRRGGMRGGELGIEMIF